MDKEEFKTIDDGMDIDDEVEYNDYSDYYQDIENWIMGVEIQERLENGDLTRDDDYIFYNVIDEWAKEIKINNKKGN